MLHLFRFGMALRRMRPSVGSIPVRSMRSFASVKPEYKTQVKELESSLQLSISRYFDVALVAKKKKVETKNIPQMKMRRKSNRE